MHGLSLGQPSRPMDRGSGTSQRSTQRRLTGQWSSLLDARNLNSLGKKNTSMTLSGLRRAAHLLSHLFPSYTLPSLVLDGKRLSIVLYMQSNVCASTAMGTRQSVIACCSPANPCTCYMGGKRSDLCQPAVCTATRAPLSPPALLSMVEAVCSSLLWPALRDKESGSLNPCYDWQDTPVQCPRPTGTCGDMAVQPTHSAPSSLAALEVAVTLGVSGGASLLCLLSGSCFRPCFLSLVLFSFRSLPTHDSVPHWVASRFPLPTALHYFGHPFSHPERCAEPRGPTLASQQPPTASVDRSINEISSWAHIHA